MIECFGRIFGGSGERVTGRICVVGEQSLEAKHTARILFFDGRADIGETVDGDTVGIMVANDGYADYLLRMGCSAPVFVIGEEYAELLPYIINRIAILDCPGQRLYVDPSIEVIKRYFGCLAALPPKKIPWLGLNERLTGSEGAVVCAVGDEEGVYDRLCELAEQSVGTRIVVKICSEDRLLEQVRGVLRAAVWGRISLTYDAKTPALADRYMEISHTAYRSLEKEGREFNGFISKGIWISTPILLLSPPDRYADFFVLDARAIIDGFLGGAEDTAAARRVMEHMADLARRTREQRVSLCAEGRYGAESLEYLCPRNAVREIYTDLATAKRINGLI